MSPPSKSHKQSWLQELNHAFPELPNFDDIDDQSFQKMVDQRCVDNMRMLIVDSVQYAKAGHAGTPMGMAEVGYQLYRHVMKYNPKDPKWFNRDRFVLSVGHACLLQYVCLHLAGFQSVQVEDLKGLFKVGGRTPAHPENTVTEGVEVTTGLFGQGVANAVGIALAEAHLAARFNKPDCLLVDHRTYCIMGDGCAMEGISYEAASLAAHWKLHKLTLIYDDNLITVDGPTSLAFTEDVSARFAALGWHTITVDNVLGDMTKFKDALLSAFHETEKPTFIRVCPLGQGVANAVGIALAEAHLAARFNKPDCLLVDHRTYCIMGDGCAMEGISYEAASLAAHWKLHKLTLIYDDNLITVDGLTSLAFSEDVSARFAALGWYTITVDNVLNDMTKLKDALLSAFHETEKPTFIRVKTLIGRSSEKEGTVDAHYGTFNEDDVKKMRQKVKWNNREPFHVIPEVYREMQIQSDLGEKLQKKWLLKLKYFRSKYPEEAAEFDVLLNGGLPSQWESCLPKWSTTDPVDAVRGYSEKCLNHLAKVIPGLIGGSADLASSTKVYLHDYDDFSPPDSTAGRNILYGVREHAMGAISNGIALHGSGLIPLAATYLVFSDYMKNAIRLSALSHAGVIYVMTHDSIAVGENGPTHQPVEHLTGLRAVPRLLVFRPADGNETAGAYKVAVANREVPSVIALARQKVAANVEGTSAEGVEKGGYIVSDNSDGSLPEIILIGTGSELCLCEGSARRLRKEGRKVRVVSLVCWRLYDRQTDDYKEKVLPAEMRKRVSVEAGSPIGWREYVGREGKVIGVDDFGESGPYLDIFKKFGFTEDYVTKVAKSLLFA